MAKPFSELREHLLRAGVAPRHVRRYLTELAEHLADLTAEEQRAGRSHEEANSAALLRLGTMESLSRAMTQQRQFQSWAVRAPWAIFGLVPLGLLAGTWLLALLMLWSGWQVFLPGADTPFGSVHGGLEGLANLYFQSDRALYFGAPVLIGWIIGVLAIRQRVQVLWPAGGLVLIALLGGMAQVHASRTAVPDGFGHIRLGFTLGSTMPLIPYAAVHTLILLSFTMLPYLVRRIGMINTRTV